MATKAELESQIADLTEQLAARDATIESMRKQVDRLAETNQLRDRCARYEDVIDQLNGMIKILRDPYR